MFYLQPFTCNPPHPTLINVDVYFFWRLIKLCFHEVIKIAGAAVTSLIWTQVRVTAGMQAVIMHILLPINPRQFAVYMVSQREINDSENNTKNNLSL